MAKNKNKPIVELNKPKGKVVAYWESAKEASEFHKINQVNISYNVNGITKQAKGHYFRFATPAEIAMYRQIKDKLKPNEPEKSVEGPAVPLLTSPPTPADIIPEVVKKTEPLGETPSVFEQMLKKYKKKFNDNSI